MTKEERELLIKDLCARLPYGVMLQVTNSYAYHHENVAKIGDITIDKLKTVLPNRESVTIYRDTQKDWSWYIDEVELDDIKPYLRPMSSMTEEEKLIFKNDIIPTLDKYDFLLEHHFDFRGLIRKGLALEAPEGMYVIK